MDFKQLYLQEQKINELLIRFNQAENINEIFLDLKEKLTEIFDCERITIFAIDKRTKQLYSRIKTGREHREIRLLINRKSIAGYVAATRKLVNLEDAYLEEERIKKYPGLGFDASWDERSGFRTRSVLACPLILKEKYLVGVLQLINKKRSSFSKEDEVLAKKIAPGLASALYHLYVFQNRFGKFDYLLESHKITYEELDLAIIKARKATELYKQDVAWVLINEFGVPKEEVGKSLAYYYDTEFIAYQEDVILPVHLFKNLNIDYLKTRFWLPFKEENGLVFVLIDDPADQDKTQEIYFSGLGDKIKFVVGLREDILKFLELYEKENKGDRGVSEVLKELKTETEVEEQNSTYEEDGLNEEAPAIIRLVTKLIKDAYESKVSDIHIEPYPGKNPALVRFRRDGQCYTYSEIPGNYVRAVVNRIKIMSNLDIAEKRLPQSGKIKIKYGTKIIELRVEITPTVGGLEDIVLRILASGEPKKLEEMNFTPFNLKRIKEIISKPYGIFLVVGPTGSGKTTTLHSILAYLNTPDKKIWTAEDPVEITQKGLRQVQVNPKIGYTFAAAMRSFLRADPDIIMVGEMRDQETAHIALEASLTGHLVLSTLHTNSAPETIVRLIDMGMNPFNFADALLGILAQRLVKTLCPECKEEYLPLPEEIELLKQEYGEEFVELNLNLEKVKLARSKGCKSCGNTGYRGRTAIHELLLATEEIKRLIVEKAPVSEIFKVAKKQGMRTLKQDGIYKVLQGQTDFASVRKVCIL